MSGLVKAGTKVAKSGLEWLQQLLPGVKPQSGVARIPDRPGMYSVDPSKMRDAEWLRRAEKVAEHEADIATFGPGHNRPFSIKGNEQSRSSNMLLGALNELKYANMRGTPKGTKEAVKGLVYVDKSGNVRGGAAINKVKADEYLGDSTDLDFTKASPNYMEYISTTSGDVKGSDLMRELQKLYGDDMVFQVANPKKNVPIYESWGAKRMPLKSNGEDVLDGGPGLPAFRIEDRVVEKTPAEKYAEWVKLVESKGQQRLEGFKKGGLAALRGRCHG